jgi:hypothetical protein
MSKGGNSLHFNSVSSIEGVVEDTWGIDNLPVGIVVLEMTEIKVLGGKSVWLDINVSVSHIVH